MNLDTAMRCRMTMRTLSK